MTAFLCQMGFQPGQPVASALPGHHWKVSKALEDTERSHGPFLACKAGLSSSRAVSAHHGGQQAGPGGHGAVAGVQQHEAAGAVGVLGLLRAAALPEHRCLLVAQAPCTCMSADNAGEKMPLHPQCWQFESERSHVTGARRRFWPPAGGSAAPASPPAGRPGNPAWLAHSSRWHGLCTEDEVKAPRMLA